MQQSKHTPGPWTAVRTKYRTLINCHDGSPVAQCESLTDADMALIAAAPELLAALQKAVRYGGLFPDLEAEARAAIAKALES